MIQQLPAPPAPPPPPDLGSAQEVIVRTDPSIFATMDPAAIVMIVVAALLVSGFVLFPLIRAIARRIEGGARQTGVDPAEFEEMRHRLAELEQRQMQMRELEERVDFAERLLAERARDDARIEPRGGVT